jgi:hypothetical protein
VLNSSAIDKKTMQNILEFSELAKSFKNEYERRMNEFDNLSIFIMTLD